MVAFALCLLCNVVNADDRKPMCAQCSKQSSSLPLLCCILDVGDDDLAIAAISKCAMIENQSQDFLGKQTRGYAFVRS